MGVKVTDEAVWKRVESGELTGFSVMGLARREPVEDAQEDLVMEKKGLGGLAEQFIEKIKRGLLGAGGEGHVDETAPPAVVEKEEVLEALARDETGEADSERDAEATAISKSEPEIESPFSGIGVIRLGPVSTIVSGAIYSRSHRATVCWQRPKRSPISRKVSPRRRNVCI